MQIPAKPEDLKIDRSNGLINIRLRYQEIFYVSFGGKDYDIHVFNFDANVTQPVDSKR